MASMTIPQWCKSHAICRNSFYKLDRDGKAPRSMKFNANRRISDESDAEWVHDREAETAEKKLAETAKTKLAETAKTKLAETGKTELAETGKTELQGGDDDARRKHAR